MIKKIINERISCGLDIGSQKIKAAILKIQDHKEVELLGAYENKAQGFKGLSVTDLNELSESIYSIINELSKRSGIKIKEVELGIGAELVDAKETQAVIPLADRGNKIITPADVKKVNHQAKLLGMKMDEDILHELPQCYLVDDVNTALNPIGLYGRKIGVQSILIVSNINRTKNIVHAVNHAGFDVSHLSLSSYRASDILFSDQDRSEGSVLVDIGSKSTTILVFKDGVLKYFDKVLLGGDNFTTAIASQLNLTFDLAEEIKKSYAGALNSDAQLKEEILVKKDNQYMPIKREIIYQSIESEILHLITGIRTSIKSSGLSDRINRGITMIGGGALLTGLIERVGQALDYSVKLGKLKLSFQKNLCNVAIFSSVLGLANYSISKNSKWQKVALDQMSWRRLIVNRIKELYEEYF